MRYNIFLLFFVLINFICFASEENKIILHYEKNIKIQTTAGWYDGICIDCNNCWINFYNTEDGGNSWKKPIITKDILKILEMHPSNYNNEKNYLSTISILINDSFTVFLNNKVGWLWIMWPKIHDLWKTKDGGITWLKCLKTEPHPLTASDLQIFDEKNIVMWSNWYDKQISFFSQDGGKSWKKCGEIKEMDLVSKPYFYNLSNGLSIIYDHKIKKFSLAKSYDHGCTWEPFYIFYEAKKDFGINGEVFSLNGENIWIAGGLNNGLYYSNDGGKSFNLILDADKDSVTGVYFKNLQQGYIILSESVGDFLYYTNDSGKTWRKLQFNEMLNQEFCKDNKVLWQRGRLLQVISKQYKNEKNK